MYCQHFCKKSVNKKGSIPQLDKYNTAQQISNIPKQEFRLKIRNKRSVSVVQIKINMEPNAAWNRPLNPLTCHFQPKMKETKYKLRIGAKEKFKLSSKW